MLGYYGNIHVEEIFHERKFHQCYSALAHDFVLYVALFVLQICSVEFPP